MKIFISNRNIPTIQKIALAGLFVALVAVLQKVVAVNYIPGLPFFRISFGGPALIIYSSILLGPWYGLMVGMGSDLLGYFVFDMSGSGWFPQITLIYALLGFFSYYVFWLVNKFKTSKKLIFIEAIFLCIFLVCIVIYFVLNPDFELWLRILIPSLIALLMILYLVFIFIYTKKEDSENKKLVLKISLTSFIVETLILLFFGSLMKALAFGFDIFLLIFICQNLVLFVNISIDTVLIYLLLKIKGVNFHD